nr:MAG TPA: hypothetical protein [Caudoviricetes sp.]
MFLDRLSRGANRHSDLCRCNHDQYRHAMNFDDFLTISIAIILALAIFG